MVLGRQTPNYLKFGVSADNTFFLRSSDSPQGLGSVEQRPMILNNQESGSQTRTL